MPRFYDGCLTDNIAVIGAEMEPAGRVQILAGAVTFYFALIPMGKAGIHI